MTSLLKFVIGAIVILIILGMAINSCESKKVCDVATGKQCQYENTCAPLLLDLIFN
jgi:hypothetical protein